MVNQRHSKVHQRDYDKAYAPVVDFTTFVAVLLLAVVINWYFRHVDVKAPFCTVTLIASYT